MSEYQGFDLPHGVSEDDLVYLRLRPEEPSAFESLARWRGWDVYVEEGSEDSRYKAFYALVREVPITFDDAEVAKLQDKIGIVDKWGELIDGYMLWAKRVGDEQESEPDHPFFFVTETDRLFFQFEGFPTAETMDVLQKLLESQPNHSSRWMRLLGYLGNSITWDK